MNLHDRIVGTPLERLEDQRLLTGQGRYVDDLHVEGMLHAVIVRSTVAHGRLRGIDVQVAKNMSGVHTIITAGDIARAYQGTVPRVAIRAIRIPQLEPMEQWVIATEKVRYVGEPVAVVVASSAAEAEDAADEVIADIEALDPVTDWRESASDASLLFDALPSNRAITYTATKGSARDCRGSYTRRETFCVQRHSGFPMETRGLLAAWDGHAQRMTVYGAAKVPFFARRTLAAAMQLPLESVDMIEVDVGGSFGMRGEFYPEDFLVPFASKLLNRPVKWIEDRRESLLGSNHSREMECDLEIVCAADGRVLALRGSVSVDAGAYVRATGVIPGRFVALLLSGPYDIPNIHIESTLYLTNKAPVGTYRGPGLFEADFFRERLFDMAARDLGMDPAQFRRLNLVQQRQMPYAIATLDLPPETDELDSGDYQVTLDRCMADFGWNDKMKLQGRLIDGSYHGLAIGCFVDGGAGGIKEHARIELEEDGLVSVYIGSASVGQGLVTILTQIAADALLLPAGCIRIFHGSTTYLKEGVGSGYSRSTVMGGSVILTAVLALKKRIAEVAAEMWGCVAEDVQIGNGLSASFRENRLTREELCKLRGAQKLSVEAEFVNHHHTYAYGAAAAHVTVDPRTGKVDLVDYLTVEDLGRVINPLTARGQAVGAVAQGLGGVFLENLVYDSTGQMLSGSLADYMMPTATDFPSVRAEVLELCPAPHNPLGAKGGGEGGVIPVGGVVANAVAAALATLKVEPRVLPLTPESVWQLIQCARSVSRTGSD